MSLGGVLFRLSHVHTLLCGQGSQLPLFLKAGRSWSLVVMCWGDCCPSGSPGGTCRN